MKNANHFHLLMKLISGIIIGILIGYMHNDFITRGMLTFNGIFGQFLSFTIPLLIVAFVTTGIAELGKSGGKLLLITVILACCSTILVGLITYFGSINFLSSTVASNVLTDISSPDGTLSAFISPKFPPVMDIISALILAFVLGVGIAVTGSSTLLSLSREFQSIIQYIVSRIIIPLLPFYIAGVFANITYSGKIIYIIKTFAGVFALVITFHICILLVLYFIAAFLSKKNPFILMKNMLPAYFTALGTQSSAATIPVSISCMKSNGVRERVADFVAPLCASIHMSGSMTTITICSLSVMLLSGVEPTFTLISQFVFALSFAMVAAPGVPGGAVFAALPFLVSILGFNEHMTALMIALYLTQDSFGTACNVTGDGAIAVIINTIEHKLK